MLTTGAVLLIAAIAAPVARAQGLAPQQRLCDPEYQDCRADLLTYIAQENVEIDMGFWLMDDVAYANALIAARQRGVKIRLLMDPDCTIEHPACAGINTQLSQAGLPMRKSIASGILHWKVALFAGQGQIEFSGANYSPFEMMPAAPYQNYTDEIVLYTNDPSLVHSFMSKFDDLWTSTTEFGNYANVTGPLTRSYPKYPEDPQLNFPPDENYRSRAIAAYNAETAAIDVAMFRITDEQESNAMIAAVNRGVPVRLYTDETEYRNPQRLWDAYNVDKMYSAGVTIRVDDHQGINHEKLVILHGQGMTIFGSSNWTSPSADSQREHNMFTTQAWIFAWAQNQYDRKWTNGSGFAESKPFTPLPPDSPVYNLPAGGATAVATTGVSLSWNGGLWGQVYDIYFGTSPDPPLLAQNQKLGPSQSATDYRAYALPPLQPGTTYYWKIVSKTMAAVAAPGSVSSFTTAGTPTAPAPPLPGGCGGSNLLWQNSSNGQLAIWSLNGAAVTATVSLTVSLADPTWHIAGSGDLDGDGCPDIVWQHDGDGQIVVWFMRGTQMLSQGLLSIPQVADTNWRIRGIADLNGDGHADLIWQHRTQGWLAVWYMSGLQVLGTDSLSVNQIDPVWKIVGAGDTDGNGTAEIIFQHQTQGWLASWTVIGATVSNTRLLSVNRMPDLNWQVHGVGDVDGDGRADLIWQNDVTGGLGVWLLNGPTVTLQQTLSIPRIADTRWKIVGPR